MKKKGYLLLLPGHGERQHQAAHDIERQAVGPVHAAADVVRHAPAHRQHDRQRLPASGRVPAPGSADAVCHFIGTPSQSNALPHAASCRVSKQQAECAVPMLLSASRVREIVLQAMCREPSTLCMAELQTSNGVPTC